MFFFKQTCDLLWAKNVGSIFVDLQKAVRTSYLFQTDLGDPVSCVFVNAPRFFVDQCNLL